MLEVVRGVCQSVDVERCHDRMDGYMRRVKSMVMVRSIDRSLVRSFVRSFVRSSSSLAWRHNSATWSVVSLPAR